MTTNYNQEPKLTDYQQKIKCHKNINKPRKNQEIC